MVQEENVINDGADEQMLGSSDVDRLAAGREEVKFVKGDHQNGDAKIDIGAVNGKAFTGMSKEELMKYANDPFWVRLRWIFFISFWAIWVGMLVGAILIIVNAPKCAAPQPLAWYKRGPLAKFNTIEPAADDVETARKIQATGAIYALPAALTYSVKQPDVEAKIKQIVEQYKDSDINVIIDLTPNYVSKDSQLMKDALENEDMRGAFFWADRSAQPPNNWLSIKENGTAWSKVGDSYVLSQFGDGLYDLHMNHTIVKRELGGVLRHLVELGVKGIRLKNSKFFLLSKNMEDETPSSDPKDKNYGLENYGFWTHTQTTFQNGLGDVLYDYMSIVKNASVDAFLSVAEDIVRPDVYQTTSGGMGIDLPMYGPLVKTLSSSIHEKNIRTELTQTMSSVGNNSWLQWNFADVYIDTPVDPSAFALFMSLLPGVPVIPVDSISYTNITAQIYRHIEQLRLSSSYMHGDFDFLYNSGTLIAYSRIKSGNPGYFVVFNPTDKLQTGNYTNQGLPDKMTVDVLSDNYSVDDIKARSRMNIDAMPVSPYSTIILTYVPVKTG